MPTVCVGNTVSCDYVRFGAVNYNAGYVPSHVVYRGDKPSFIHAAGRVKRIHGTDIILNTGQRIPMSCASVTKKDVQ